MSNKKIEKLEESEKIAGIHDGIYYVSKFMKQKAVYLHAPLMVPGLNPQASITQQTMPGVKIYRDNDTIVYEHKGHVFWHPIENVKTGMYENVKHLEEI